MKLSFAIGECLTLCLLVCYKPTHTSPIKGDSPLIEDETLKVPLTPELEAITNIYHKWGFKNQDIPKPFGSKLVKSKKHSPELTEIKQHLLAFKPDQQSHRKTTHTDLSHKSFLDKLKNSINELQKTFINRKSEYTNSLRRGQSENSIAFEQNFPRVNIEIFENSNSIDNEMDSVPSEVTSDYSPHTPRSKKSDDVSKLDDNIPSEMKTISGLILTLENNLERIEKETIDEINTLHEVDRFLGKITSKVMKDVPETRQKIKSEFQINQNAKGEHETLPNNGTSDDHFNSNMTAADINFKGGFEEDFDKLKQKYPEGFLPENDRWPDFPINLIDSPSNPSKNDKAKIFINVLHNTNSTNQTQYKSRNVRDLLDPQMLEDIIREEHRHKGRKRSHHVSRHK